MIEAIGILGEYLIPFMIAMLALALTLRLAIYRSSKRDQVYFGTFNKEIDKLIQSESQHQDQIRQDSAYIHQLIDKIEKGLPRRTTRFYSKKRAKAAESEELAQKAQKVFSLRSYTSGNRSLINSLKVETRAFESSHPPNFTDLTTRVLGRDENWNKVFRVIPIDGAAAFIDMLPSLFIVFGILGTFVGIALALPVIGTIDVSASEQTTEVLNTFVNQVAFAMNSSITGIICSIINSWLNGLFPVLAVREKMRDSLESSLENFWYFLHGQGSEEETRTLYNKIIHLVGQLSDKLDNSDSSSKIAKLRDTV